MSNNVIRFTEGLKDRKLLTSREVCRLYGFTKWGLQHLVRKRRIPIVKIGRRIYFDPKKLDSWVEEHEIEAMD